ncbi:MAG: FtsW/RodA/SpoVE family cell cycle protein [Armatimonadota bacterium]
MSASGAEMTHVADAAGSRAETTIRPMDRAYFLGVWALMVIGIIFVFSASFPTASRPDAMLLPGDPYRYLVQHAKFVALGVVAMLLVSLVPVRFLRKAAPWAFGVGVVLIGLALVSPWGVTLGGARRWLALPGVPTFQPSELMKVALILLVAHFLAQKDEKPGGASISYAWTFVLAGVAGALLLLQRDQGMATLYVAVVFALLLFARMRLWILSLLATGGLALGLFIASREPYRWERIKAFLDPENAPADAGYHILNMLIAQARGGVTGMGLGMSPDKWRWLPAPHTDSIFSVIGAETGLIGAMIVMIAVGVLAWRGLLIARRSSSAFGFYAAAGVSALLCIQGLMHIAVNTSCMPVTGLTLPFISGGGTSLLSASICAGVVLAVSRCRGRGEA